ncbi:MAG: reverse transcriptase-like protein [Candidatus Moranbacteria bacterium]|nr:reverse transcriptase-like protein [Candidatus Moranbacteria bacterium]
MVEQRIVIKTDGGARGNPGPAAIAGVVRFFKGKELRQKLEFADYIGQATNNEAEYQALIQALKQILTFLGKTKAKKTRVQSYVDSELIAKQIAGDYRVKKSELKKYFNQYHELATSFEQITVTHVRREKNKRADKLLNQKLDQVLKSKK